MNQTLSKSAQSVQNVLGAHGLDCKVIELSAGARTAADAASALGCHVSQIVKSLIFKTKATNQPVLVLASGSNRVNEKVIEAHLGEKITKADADFTREITGFAIGGIPPIGHKNPIDHIFIDLDLLTFTTVWAAAGTPHAVFQINSQDLRNLTNGIVTSIQ